MKNQKGGSEVTAKPKDKRSRRKPQGKKSPLDLGHTQAIKKVPRRPYHKQMARSKKSNFKLNFTTTINNPDESHPEEIKLRLAVPAPSDTNEKMKTSLVSNRVPYHAS